MFAAEEFAVAAVLFGDEHALHAVHVFGEQQAGLAQGPERIAALLGRAGAVIDVEQRPFAAQQVCGCRCAVRLHERCRGGQRPHGRDELAVVGAAGRSPAARVVQPGRAEQRHEEERREADQRAAPGGRGRRAGRVRGCRSFGRHVSSFRFVFNTPYNTSSNTPKLHHCRA
jgi:hypothetical protein